MGKPQKKTVNTFKSRHNIDDPFSFAEDIFVAAQPFEDFRESYGRTDSLIHTHWIIYTHRDFMLQGEIIL